MGWSEPAPVAVWMEIRRVGWLQSRIFSSDAGSTPPSKSGERSRSNRVSVSRRPLRLLRPLCSRLPSLHLIHVSENSSPSHSSLSPRRSHTLAGAPPPHPTAAASSGPSTRAGRAAPAREQPRLGGAELLARLGGAELTAAGRRDSARPPRLLRRTSLLPHGRAPRSLAPCSSGRDHGRASVAAKLARGCPRPRRLAPGQGGEGEGGGGVAPARRRLAPAAERRPAAARAAEEAGAGEHRRARRGAGRTG